MDIITTTKQPEQAIKDCRNCKFGDYNDRWNTNFCYCSDDCNNWDKWEPSAQPDPVKHGEWVYKGARGRFPICECSVCGNAENADWAILGDNVNYCPRCGAKMDGGKDDPER